MLETHSLPDRQPWPVAFLGTHEFPEQISPLLHCPLDSHSTHVKVSGRQAPERHWLSAVHPTAKPLSNFALQKLPRGSQN